MSRPCLDNVIETYIYSLTPNSLNLDSLDLRINMIDFRKKILQHNQENPLIKKIRVQTKDFLPKNKEDL